MPKAHKPRPRKPVPSLGLGIGKKSGERRRPSVGERRRHSLHHWFPLLAQVGVPSFFTSLPEFMDFQTFCEDQISGKQEVWTKFTARPRKEVTLLFPAALCSALEARRRAACFGLARTGCAGGAPCCHSAGGGGGSCRRILVGACFKENPRGIRFVG